MVDIVSPILLGDIIKNEEIMAEIIYHAMTDRPIPADKDFKVGDHVECRRVDENGNLVSSVTGYISSLPDAECPYYGVTGYSESVSSRGVKYPCGYWMGAFSRKEMTHSPLY